MDKRDIFTAFKIAKYVTVKKRYLGFLSMIFMEKITLKEDI